MKYSIAAILWVAVMFVFSGTLRAQNNYEHSDYFNLTSFSLLIYEADIHVDSSNEELQDDSLRGNYSGGYAFETIFGLFTDNIISLGLGVGYQSYTEIGLNTLPIFLDVRLWGNAPETVMVFLKLGGMARIQKDFGRGSFVELGAGMKFLFANKIPMTLSAFIGASGVSFTNERYQISDKTARMTTGGFSLGFFF